MNGDAAILRYIEVDLVRVPIASCVPFMVTKSVWFSLSLSISIETVRNYGFATMQLSTFLRFADCFQELNITTSHNLAFRLKFSSSFQGTAIRTV